MTARAHPVRPGLAGDELAVTAMRARDRRRTRERGSERDRIRHSARCLDGEDEGEQAGQHGSKDGRAVALVPRGRLDILARLARVGFGLIDF
jgi:hypothetical protein